MIRVLHFGLGSSLGGIETYLYKLYSNIDRNKYKFDFVINGVQKPCFYDEFISMGSDFFHVTKRRKNPFKNKYDINKILREENFDIIHCHLNSLSYTLPVHLALKHNYPVIVHSRNAGILKSRVSRTLHIMNSVLLPKNKITMLAVSDYAGEWMFGKNSEFKVVNNGLKIEKYKFDESTRNKIRENLGIKNENIILHLGAMRQQKNHMFLLEIFNKFLRIKPNSKLLLVGNGVLKEKILCKIDELKITDKIIIMENRNDIKDILSASDVFLFPSLYEGFPNAVLEAQTSGLPCLISDTITKEVVINENCYRMSLNQSTTEWANSLSRMIQFEDRTLGAQNIKDKGLSVEYEVKKIENVYEDLLVKSKRF